jgi:hypothetical protein
VRGTAGGDRLPSSFPPSTPSASLTAVNIMLNSTVSDNAFFGSVDLADFYLGTPVSLPIPQRQFIRIDIDTFSPAVLSHLLHFPYIRTASSGKRYIVFRIDQTMYGLKEAGKLSNLRLVSLLSSAGFIETRTPCLFRHLTRPIAFVLVVDDFGVKYQNRDDFEFDISCLFFVSPLPGQGASRRHQVLRLRPRPQPQATHDDPLIPTLATSARTASSLRPRRPPNYVPPHYGSSAPQRPTSNSSPPATPTQKKELQVAIGYLLYYERCVDGRVLPATCALASVQTTATQRTMAELDRLLGFVAA